MPDEKFAKSDFFDAYTDFQCLIIAQLNKMDFSGISANQYNLIEHLYRNGPATTSQLAKKFCVSLPAISRQIKQLLDREMLTQLQGKTDRRLFYLEVAVKGKKLVNESENIRKSISVAITGILDANELEQFTAACVKIVSNIHL